MCQTIFASLTTLCIDLNDTDVMIKKVAHRNALKAMTLMKRYPGSVRYDITGEMCNLKSETMHLMQMLRKSTAPHF